jgi:Ca2+-binding EF-hand superfamily protein
VPQTFRFVNDRDFVPTYPPQFLGYCHVTNLIHMSEQGMWLNPPDEVTKKGGEAQRGETRRTGMAKLRERLGDHNAHRSYMLLLRFHRTMRQLDEQSKSNLKEAWKALTHSSQVAKRQMNIRFDTTSDAAEIIVQPLVEPDVAAMQATLQIDDATAESLILMMRHLTRDRVPCNFYHFTIAAHRVFYDANEPRRARRIALARMGLAFDKFDADLDGTISRDEFGKIWDDEEMRKLAFGTGERNLESIDALFKELDVDASGGLSRIEFSSIGLLVRRVAKHDEAVKEDAESDDDEL